MLKWSKIKSMLAKKERCLVWGINFAVLICFFQTFSTSESILIASTVMDSNPVRPSASQMPSSEVLTLPEQLNIEMRANSEIDSKFETDRWERYVRRFRRAHNVSLTSGYDQGVWRIGQFGDVKGEEAKSSGIDLTVQYSYHAQLYEKFGYYLGSSGGYFGELEKRGSKQVGSSSAWKLPGVVVGFVYCFDPRWRVMFGVDGYLSRYTKLSSTENGEDIDISMSSESIDGSVSVDYFLSLNWGIRLSVYDRKNWLPRPLDSEIYPTNAKLSRRSRGATIGMVFHFL